MSTDFSLLKVYEEAHKGMSVTFRFYEEAPAVSGGGGGWQGVQRPQEAVVTAWRGPTDPYTMQLQLIMDKFTASPRHGSQPDIEGDCRTLEKMYGAFTHPTVEPPLLILDANGALQNDVYNRPSARWVIPDPPDYADVLRNDSGRRTRQVVTVKFMHYLRYDELTRNRVVSQNAPRHTFVASAQVDTFRKAAAKYLKSYGGARWGTRLANLNGKRDPNAKLLPGRRYKLPTAAQVRQWEKTTRR